MIADLLKVVISLWMKVMRLGHVHDSVFSSC